jgi:nitrite reductase/ring-hydroxylating ferredoxin subunit
MAEKVLVGHVDDIDAHGNRIIQDIEGLEVCVFNLHGEYLALANYCLHEAGPVCEGALTGQIIAEADDFAWDWKREGELIECPWHNWTFDVKSGDNIQDPTYSIPTFDVEVVDGDIYVSL